jgi:hypothetical protein
MTPRATLITKSLGCFDAGLASLIPGIGLLVAPIAFLRFRFVIVETNDRWNPARFHLYTGAILALFSLLTHALVGLGLYFHFTRDVGNG